MDETLQKALNEFTTTILTLVLTVIVPYALSLAREWVKAKTAAIEDTKLREGIEFALNRLDLTAETVVEELRQTMVKRDEHGKVENPGALQEQAVSSLFSRLDPTTQATIKKMFPANLKNVLKGKIESKIKPFPKC